MLLGLLFIHSLYATNTFSLLLPFFLLPGTLSAQQIATERVIPVKSYDIRQMGYPSDAVPAGTGRFAFLQYWPKDDYHPTENYYLQCLDATDYQAYWYQPVTEAGYEPMQISDLVSLEGALLVTGYQYLAKAKRIHAVGRFFDLEGKPLSREPVQISTYDKKAKKEFNEEYILSPAKEKVMWMASDGNRTFFSVWGPKGNKIWGKELSLPHTDAKYELSRTVVDDEGNPVFLLRYQKPSWSIKDTLYPPLLVHYDHRKEAFKTDTLGIDSAFVVEAEMAFLPNGELVIAGVSSDNYHKGLSNGAKISDEPRRWNYLFMKRYAFSDSIALLADSVSGLPESWTEAYGTEGCNFTEAELYADKRGTVLVFQEAYQLKERTYFYDLGCLGFDHKSGALRWGKVIEKRQRSQRGPDFFSYVSGIDRGKLHFVYLTEWGAPGIIRATSLDIRSGKVAHIKLASNETSHYLFHTRDASMLTEGQMILIGLGDPSLSDFKLVTIQF